MCSWKFMCLSSTGSRRCFSRWKKHHTTVFYKKLRINSERKIFELKMHCYRSTEYIGWLCQYLTNRKAQNRKRQTKMRTIKEGILQVLSTIPFIIFMINILDKIPIWIHSSIYADYVIWCSKEFVTTANAIM